MKTCIKCSAPKNIGDFYKNKRNRDGLDTYCKSCRREYMKNYHKEHPEYGREYYEKHKDDPGFKEKSRNKWKSIYTSNPRFRKQHRKKNAARLRLNPELRSLPSPERRASLVQSWRERNRSKTIEYRQRRRSRLSTSGEHFTTEEWLILCRHYGNKCLRCGEQKPLSVDHVIPICKGGSNAISNIQPLCRSCNSAKGTNTIDYRP